MKKQFPIIQLQSILTQVKILIIKVIIRHTTSELHVMKK